MKRKKKIFIGLLSSSLVFMFIIYTQPVATFFSNATNDHTIPTFMADEQDELYQKIITYNDQHKIDPIDATIDRVWKAIPGYNGLQVDIKASYENMKGRTVLDPDKIVFKEVSPSVHLDDLEPSPIYRGNPEKPMVSLLINVAWGNEYIPGILETLENTYVKATFFFDGSWVKKNPALAAMIYLHGHEIGNHAYSHPDLKFRSRAETMDELKKTNDIIEKTLAVKPEWFAPPSGSFNDVTTDVAHELGMKTILWTVDTVDWRKPNTSEMVARVVSNVGNGSMILMHPTKPVEEGLETMINEIKEKGYQIGTVSELMSEKRIDN
ncbi:polysaccharide deacetylase family protein [Sporosarcina soli]|uniref:Polysaccharide deacetylase family protein n=1 Tax=Sporosarcina soli TaxID=334736 RepID=A0ABW0TN84_9BACL